MNDKGSRSFAYLDSTPRSIFLPSPIHSSHKRCVNCVLMYSVLQDSLIQYSVSGNTNLGTLKMME